METTAKRDERGIGNGQQEEETRVAGIFPEKSNAMTRPFYARSTRSELSRSEFLLLCTRADHSTCKRASEGAVFAVIFAARFRSRDRRIPPVRKRKREERDFTPYASPATLIVVQFRNFRDNPRCGTDVESTSYYEQGCYF